MLERDREVPIGTVDVRQLGAAPTWPIMRLLARQFVDQVRLHHYVRGLLATHRWSQVRVVPHPDAGHVYDVFAVPAQPAEGTPPSYRTAI